MPITTSGFSVSIKQWNSGTLLTTDCKFRLILLLLSLLLLLFILLYYFLIFNAVFFFTGVDVFVERELVSSTLKLFEDLYLPHQN